MIVPVAVRQLFTQFQENFDFERYERFGELKQLELLVDGEVKKVIDGLKKIVVCSQEIHFDSEVEFIFCMPNQEHHYFEIDLRFD